MNLGVAHKIPYILFVEYWKREMLNISKSIYSECCQVKTFYIWQEQSELGRCLILSLKVEVKKRVSEFTFPTAWFQNDNKANRCWQLANCNSVRIFSPWIPMEC